MRKTPKFALLTLLCCLSLFFIVPECTLSADAAAGNGTVQPQAEIKEWIFKIENYKLYKRLYNHSTNNWEGDWIYVRDLTQEEIDNLNK